jgi:methionyl-tRNA formyltransferase
LHHRIIFLGSPEFAVPSLRALAGQYDIVAVVTQPDRPAGRGRQLSAPPVKEAATELGLPVWQPEALRGEEAVERLRSYQAGCAVVVAYGEILRPQVLAVPPKGFLNVHASLLPKYRGASPISAAVVAGERETGITIMLLDEGMDTGPILAQEALPILPADTRGGLEGKLAALGAGLLVRTLPEWLVGAIGPVPQHDSQATFSRALTREDGHIDWSRSAAYIERQCRAMAPWPGAYTHWQGKLLKLWRGHVIPRPAAAEPGTVLRAEEGIAVATGDGLLRLLSIQPEGRGPMTAEDFARGRPPFIGAVLSDA